MSADVVRLTGPVTEKWLHLHHQKHHSISTGKTHCFTYSQQQKISDQLFIRSFKNWTGFICVLCIALF